MDETEIRGLLARLQKAGWRETFNIRGEQEDPVEPEPVRIRVFSPPLPGNALLLITYLDGSAIVFIQSHDAEISTVADRVALADSGADLIPRKRRRIVS